MSSNLPTKAATGLLDKLPASFRHLAILGISWVIANGSNQVAHLHLTQLEASGAGVVLTWFALIFTPLTKQYGVGVNKGNAG